MDYGLAMAIAGRVSVSPHCAHTTALASTDPPKTESNRGSTSAKPRGFSRSRRVRSDWRPKPMRLKAFIHCRTGLGSSAALFCRHHRHALLPNARGKIQDTPRDRILINKAYSLQ